MLIGSYTYSLQAKGRVAIPAKFRQQLGTEMSVLTKGIEACAYILPFNIWSNLVKNLGDSPLASAESRGLRRLIAHDATEVEFDSQGRIIIPQGIREWAHLQKKVVIAGSIQWIEIWDLSAYKQHMAQLGEQSEVLAKKLEKFGEETQSSH